jgi:hypothetical protein
MHPNNLKYWNGIIIFTAFKGTLLYFKKQYGTGPKTHKE